MSFEQRIAFTKLMRYVEEVMATRHSSALLKLLNIRESSVLCYGVPPNMGALWSLLNTGGKFKSDKVRPMREALAHLDADVVSKDTLEKFDAYEKKYLGQVKFDALQDIVKQVVSGPCGLNLLTLLGIPAHRVMPGGRLDYDELWTALDETGQFNYKTVRPMLEALEALGAGVVSGNSLYLFRQYG